MAKRRNSLEIKAEILRIARYGTNKTKIVYRANLNFKLLKHYLDELKTNSLIIDRGRIIQTTKKGIEYLEHYDEFKNLVNVTVIV